MCNFENSLVALKENNFATFAAFCAKIEEKPFKIREKLHQVSEF